MNQDLNKMRSSTFYLGEHDTFQGSYIAEATRLNTSPSGFIAGSYGPGYDGYPSFDGY